MSKVCKSPLYISLYDVISWRIMVVLKILTAAGQLKRKGYGFNFAKPYLHSMIYPLTKDCGN